MSGFHALVLAAGSGTRFGGGKLTAPFRDGVLLDAALAAALAAPVDAVTLVTGADRGAVESAALACAARLGQPARLRLVYAAEHAEGMGASIRAGVASIPAGARGALIFLGDMPLVAEEAPRLLIDRLKQGAPAAVPTFEGRRGHPVGFAAALFPALAALEGDAGARGVLAALGSDLAEVPVTSRGVLTDVDTPADLAQVSS